jgi:hypothetical protein
MGVQQGKMSDGDDFSRWCDDDECGFFGSSVSRRAWSQATKTRSAIYYQATLCEASDYRPPLPVCVCGRPVTLRDGWLTCVGADHRTSLRDWL